MSHLYQPAVGGSIRSLPLIPITSREGHQRRLKAPVDLFDPRNSIFQQLLDPLEHFPAPPFDGSASSSSAAAGGSFDGDSATEASAVSGRLLLDNLALCGLRTQLDLPVRQCHWKDVLDLIVPAVSRCPCWIAAVNDDRVCVCMCGNLADK